ncbi:MAG: hypothetical protein RML40_07335, partial [Bacteroidota bacterium]|nr:hypothetical protein [Candidatus Kapabacteria bacterium]MDW8220330.1 hypothetical protein [Bacteroidota bacterium]
LWRHDNSTLSRVDVERWVVINDFFARVNPGLRLGDTANDMVVMGDTLYIAVSVSRTIEVLQVSTGKWLGRMRFDGVKHEPRSIVIANDTTAFCTNLNDDSITEFNPRTLQIRTTRISVGPAPEGIAATRRYIIVANSGFGDFRATEPKAGTLSVLDIATHREIRTMSGFVNAGDIITNRTKTRIYAAYRHLPSQRDSLGGIVELDAESLQELRRWRMKSPFALTLSITGDTLFYLSNNAVYCLALQEPHTQPMLAVQNEEPHAMWYGLAVHPESSELWICNARDFSVQGEMIIVRLGRALPLRRFDVGLNPNTVVFF